MSAGHCATGVTTAWLGDALALRVDEDAGTVEVENPLGAEAVAVQDCRVHSTPELTGGLDVGFCRLATPAVEPSALVWAAGGCERAPVAQGSPATLVGFGFDGENGVPGTKRLAEAQIQSVSSEIRIGDSSCGTCRGDSGGPAFVRVASPSDSQAFEWRVAGLLSSGILGDGCGTGYYTDLARVIRWLEDETRRDLSPCFADDGSWAPSARCFRTSLDVEGRLTALEPVQFSDTCGPPFDPRDGDTNPPRIDSVWLDLTTTDGHTALITVSISVSDTGWGVRRVVVELLDGHGAVVLAQDAERAPFVFETTLPDCAQKLRVTAVDHAGLATVDEQLLRAPSLGGGCALRTPRPGPQKTFVLLLTATLTTLGRWRTSKAAKSRQTTLRPGRACSRCRTRHHTSGERPLRSAAKA